MKLVLNTSYGCPALTKDALDYLGIEKLSQLSRKDEKLIDLIKNQQAYNFKVQPDYSSLEVVEVEDCAHSRSSTTMESNQLYQLYQLLESKGHQ